MSECSHNCGSCTQDCSSREAESLLKKPHEASCIKKVIGVVSGKGGVGKSSVTSMMAVTMQRRGYHAGILDADITGPSIPKVFGINKQRATASDLGIFPVQTKTGIDVISLNLMVEDETAPVIWRGPVIAGVVNQFWTDVIWNDVDFLFVDMPPGTGDVPLTVYQSIPLDGIIVVTSPQELVSMIVAKAVNMAQKMDIPILGIIENYSYVQCPDCEKHIHVFGESHVDEIAKTHNLDVLAKLPLDPNLSQVCDRGVVELFEGDYLDHACDVVEQKVGN